MTPERWERVEEVFRATLALTPNRRVSYLEKVCRDDSELKREVASLLDSHHEAGSFLDTPAVDLGEAARLFRPDQLVAERFRIERFLAEGGMGEVYEAFDTELDERVALKTIRQDVLDDDEAELRFTRESQLARRVSHPNVCRTFDVFHHAVQSGNYEARVRFLTMELLRGETLAERLRRDGPMRPDSALAIMREVAEALRAAHAVGVVHRDLKPENIMLVPDDANRAAVVTDFGLARDNKAFEGVPAKARGDLLWILHGLQAGHNPPKSMLARLAKRARRQMVALGIVSDEGVAITELGRIMGTPAYMSPEQARGDRADERSDIWSFGIVFYETLTGRLPYRPESSLRGFLRKLVGRRRTPSALRRGIPSSIRKVVFRCLVVSRLDRYQTIETLIEDLNAIESAPRFRIRRIAVGVASLIAVILLGHALGWL
jgi:serine/threonine protein kinase